MIYCRLAGATCGKYFSTEEVDECLSICSEQEIERNKCNYSTNNMKAE